MSESSSNKTGYRDWLVQAGFKVSEAYDKAVMTLSGGALGISMTFIHDLAPTPVAGTFLWLGLAWISFGTSIASILVSKLTSQWALDRALEQFDSGEIKGQRPGQGYSVLTSVLNVLAGVAFLLGVFALAWFAISNLSDVGKGSK